MVVCVTLAAVISPAVAMSPILCTFGLEQWAQANSTFFTANVALTNFTTAGILGVALLVSFFRGKPIFSGYPAVGWVTLSLFGLALLSAIWSVYSSGTIDQWRSHFPYFLTVVILTPLLIIEPKDLRTGFMATLVLGSAVLLLLLLTTERSGRTIELQADIASKTKQGGNPLAVASMAGYVAMIAVLMNFRGVARFWQVLRWFVFALALVLIIHSGSRGQTVATFLAVVLFLPISRQIKSLKGFITTLLAVVVAGGFAFMAVQMVSSSERWQLDEMMDTYSGTRLDHATLLFNHWLDSSVVHWVVGLGSSASFDQNIIGFYPHVVMVEILCEEGLVGLALFCAIIFLSLRSIYRAFFLVQDDPESRGLLAALAAMFTFDLAISFKQGSMLGSTTLFAFAIMLGRFEQAARRYTPVLEEELAVTEPASWDTSTA